MPLLIWFFLSHKKKLTYAVYDLYFHLDYVEPLRKKIEDPKYIKFSKTTKGLLLLDSFIKESVWLTLIKVSKSPFHTLSKMVNLMIYENWVLFLIKKVTTRYMAFKPFIFTDKTQLEWGNWACIPLRTILHNI